MNLFSLLGSLGRLLANGKRHDHRDRTGPAARRARFEPLEDRRLLAATLYVNDDAAGLNTGTNWANAYTDLQSALGAAVAGDEIWVAAGTYKPTAGTDRGISFRLKKGVSLYGGFAGTETTRDQRDWTTNVTTLSGDIGMAGDSTDNTHCVVDAELASNAGLDGFTITAGRGGWSGGGMCIAECSPTLSNLVFRDNVVMGLNGAFGGGLYIYHSSSTLTNVSFIGNTVGGTTNGAAAQGGGMFIHSGSPTLMNVTFTGNDADSGGAIFVYGSFVRITNGVLWGNGSGGQIAGDASVTYSIVQGGWPGTGNLDLDPVFVDAAHGNVHLRVRDRIS